ncbi:HAD family hydrolase [Clostridium sp.]|uniref:HAD family hydrolase n=1 Tax=Clostridium sp. TaxID=1506 RepID=UPI002FCC2DCB
MKSVNFITDLDRTIIHSKNKGFKCVEFLKDREITYMTEDSYKLLLNILSLKNFNFIPCTMRNIDQTLRVQFIKEYNPKIIICTNGAQIYIDGILDEAWDLNMRKFIKEKEINNRIVFLKGLELNECDIRNIEGFYIAIKCNSVEDAKINCNRIKKYINSPNRIINVHSKIFIINENINKIHAVNYIIRKFNLKNVITSGDSEVDLEFTTKGICILPKHASFKHKEAEVTEKEGIYSTEEILEKVKGYM